MSQSEHPAGDLHDLVDGRLAGDARRRVEAHVQTCAQCQRDVEAIAAVKRAVARLPQVAMPRGFDDRLAAALDAAAGDALTVTTPGVGDTPGLPNGNRPTGAATAARPAPTRVAVARDSWTRIAAPLGAAAAIILVALLSWWNASTPLPRSAAAGAADVNAGRLGLESVESDAPTLERYFTERVSFPVRVFDLGMMGFTLAGGRVHRVGDHESALWVYRGAGGSLICQMFTGSAAELPSAPETRTANGFAFLIYHESGGTQVFWQEGDVVCVLASTLPAEQVIQLAIAKAMKP